MFGISLHHIYRTARYCGRMQPALPNGRLFGTFLVATAILTTVALSHHPSIGARQSNDLAKALAEGGPLNAWFHAFIIVMIGVLYMGLVGFSQRRGLQSPLVLAGLIAATAGLAAEIGSALIDGFFVSAFGAHLLRGNPASIPLGLQVISAAVLALQILAKFGVAAQGIAILFWSIALFDRDRAHIALAIVGCGAGLLSVVVTVAVTTLNPHNVGLVFAIQAFWYAIAGVLMIRGRL
jgi:hypothetical protein